MPAPFDKSSTDLRALGRGHAAGDSFHVVTLMFQRARQLQDGARPRVDPRGHSSVRVALMEVLAGLVVAAQ
jgi:DNA-directed RNA polymerase subunit K/omega